MTLQLSAFFLACWQILALASQLANQSLWSAWRATGVLTKGCRKRWGCLRRLCLFTAGLKSSFGSVKFWNGLMDRRVKPLNGRSISALKQLPRLNGEIEPRRFFPVAFEFQDAEANYTEGDTKFSIQKQYSCFDRFKLKLSCVRRGELLVAELHYDSSFFCAEDVDRLAQEFRTLLESVCANPESPIADLDIVSPNERRQLLVEFNDTRTDYSESKCIHELFAERARHAPDNVAVVFENHRLTYAQLETRANQLAHHLQGLGVGPEVPVAICMDRSLEMVVGILAILKAGGAYVPLDPEYSAEAPSLRYGRCSGAGAANAGKSDGTACRSLESKWCAWTRTGKPSRGTAENSPIN